MFAWTLDNRPRFGSRLLCQVCIERKETESIPRAVDSPVRRDNELAVPSLSPKGRKELMVCVFGQVSGARDLNWRERRGKT